MQTVVETPPYLADAERLFTIEERTAIVETVAADPLCGVVIPGSGGIRKVRFGFGGRGQERRRARDLSIRRWRRSDLPARGIRKEREVGPDAKRADDARQDHSRHAGKLSETQMTKRAFDKIMSGLESTRDYLDGSA